MSFKTKIALGFGAALLMLVCVAVLSYRSLETDESDRVWVAHTHQVMEKLEAVLGDLIDGETGVRAFIISGDEVYLQPYREGMVRIGQDVHDLRTLTADNPTQQRALDRLEPAIRTKVDELRDKIELRRQGPAATQEIIRQGIGKPTMDKMRQQIFAMQEVERQLLKERAQAATVSSRRTRVLIVTSSSLALVFLVFAVVVIWGEIERRRKAEAEVRELNAGLEQRVAERTAELQAREQDLSRSNAELQQFAYVASHDLQEPLRMVASFTQLLARRYGDKLDQDAREFIAYAVDGATRMQTLISDLLAYSRVGTEMKPLEQVSCDQVVDYVLKTLRFAISEKRVEITRDPMPLLMADSTQLGQLWQNLVSNALKFHGGEKPEIHLGAEKNGTGWKFSVRDNGIGIPQEHAERIFVIFQRLHTKTEYPGTGIGLAICKKIVERHGGRIWFEPTPGGGTTFWFTIAAKAA
jgi:signal transduction histidine kinase